MTAVHAVGPGRLSVMARAVLVQAVEAYRHDPAVSGWLAEQVAAPSVRGHLRRSLQQLKRQVEHEQLRIAAAKRREEKQRAAAGD